MPPKKKKNPNSALIAAIIFSAVAISGSLVFFALQLGGSGDLSDKIASGIEDYVASMQEDYEQANAPAVIDIDAASLMDDDAVLGDPNAPVTIVEFSDYQCPYCESFVTNTLPLIKKNYIDTGKVKFVYRDFPIDGHDGAYPAALAAECVREQTGDEGYFKMHDIIFANQIALNNPTKDLFVGFATQAGADVSKFGKCFDEGRYREEIYADMADGRSVGVNGTPGFIVNKQAVSGAQEYAAFEQIIEAYLATE